MKSGISVAFIGSGSGSTGTAAIDAFLKGLMPSVEGVVAFISTVPEAGLLAKAKERGILPLVIDDKQTKENFQMEVKAKVFALGAQLLVSAGCRKVIPEIPGVWCINTHPQDPEKHGGDYQVGLEPHLHFLEHEVMDQLWRGRATIETPFFAKITSHSCHGHQAIESHTPYDCGDILMQVPIPIPKEIIMAASSICKPYRKPENWHKEAKRRQAIVALAEEVQQHVLTYERQLVPMFVENAAMQLLQRGKR